MRERDRMWEIVLNFFFVMVCSFFLCLAAIASEQLFFFFNLVRFVFVSVTLNLMYKRFQKKYLNFLGKYI